MRIYSKSLVSLKQYSTYNILRTLTVSYENASPIKIFKRRRSNAPSSDSTNLSSKVALVNGGSSPFGLICVKELLRCGAKGVMIADFCENEGKQKLCQICTDCETNRAAFIKSDLNNVLLLRNAFLKTKTYFNQINIILNVIEQSQEKMWTEEINQNIEGLVRSTLLGYEFMGIHKGGYGGTICNLIISPSSEGKELCPILAATKTYAISFAKEMSSKFNNKTGIKVITAFADNDVDNESASKDSSEKSDRDSISKMLESASPGSVWTLHFIKRNNN
ncbi:uncharacterized protein LOC130894661 [Diorhabda carinulata]|uniref:uncharacterized protein LOC130894661 n=1 Tax=Diorhabda carinulata TaxID=1163345 RepID=UPI0025A0D353|nr:uncharacterized protein LOC130894661 [Diorhabda carinulata]